MPKTADPFAFPPEHERTLAVDLAIRRALGESVVAVIAEAERHGLVDALPTIAWRDALLATPGAPPQLWACYHDLVQAVLHADAGAVPRLAAELVSYSPSRPGRPSTVLTIAEQDLGVVDAARYRTVIDNDPNRPLGLLPVGAGEVDRIRGLVREARSLLADTDPALLHEIDTLGHQIVLATNARRSFGGAATVFLWGAVVLNPDRVPDRITLIESLAHETAHALLFGLTLGADLTTNDPDERYGSPLRPDPRPIEGIVHATYVLARMNYALKRLRLAHGLTILERDLIEAKIASSRSNYEAGLVTVSKHAQFTSDGRAIFDECQSAMAS